MLLPTGREIGWSPGDVPYTYFVNEVVGVGEAVAVVVAQTQAAAIDAGTPLFVDFTAAWCLSCQVNERLVLDTPEIREAFEARGVALLKADWTRRDPTITAALAELGRSSVPVYALYAPGSADPVLLPSVLTKQIVLDALDSQLP